MTARVDLLAGAASIALALLAGAALWAPSAGAGSPIVAAARPDASRFASPAEARPAAALEERPLFEPTRRAQRPPAAQAKSEAAPAFQQRMLLRGLIKSEGILVALIEDQSAKRTFRVPKGAALEGATFVDAPGEAAIFRTGQGDIALPLTRVPAPKAPG